MVDDILNKINESNKLTKYEKMCVFYLLEIHIDKITKMIKKK